MEILTESPLESTDHWRHTWHIEYYIQNILATIMMPLRETLVKQNYVSLSDSHFTLLTHSINSQKFPFQV